MKLLKELDTIFTINSQPSIDEVTKVLSNYKLKQSKADLTASLTTQRLQSYQVRANYIRTLLYQAPTKTQEAKIQLILLLLQIEIVSFKRHTSQKSDESLLEKYFQKMQSIVRKDFTLLGGVFSIIDAYSYCPGRAEQQIYFVKDSLLYNRDCILLVSKLFFQILNSTFTINRPINFQPFYAQKNMDKCQSYFLHKQYGRLRLQQQQLMLKLSIMISTLNWMYNFKENSIEIIKSIWQSIFNQNRQKGLNFFKEIQNLAMRIFRQESLQTLRRPFYSDYSRFLQIIDIIKLSGNTKENYIFEVVINMISFIIMMPIKLQITDHGKNYQNILKQKIMNLQIYERQQFVLPLISQQFIKARIFSSENSQICLQHYVNNYNQINFTLEKKLMSFIQNYLNEQYIQPNMLQYCFYQLKLIICLDIDWQPRMKWCLYYLYLANLLSKPNEHGLKVLSKLMYVTVTQTCRPQDSIINMFVSHDLIETSTKVKNIIVGILAQNIRKGNIQLAYYLQYKYLGDIFAQSMVLRSAINRMGSLSYYLFEQKGNIATEKEKSIINQYMKYSDLDIFKETKNNFIKHFAKHNSQFKQSNNANNIYLDFMQLENRIIQCCQRSELVLWNGQSLRNIFSQIFNFQMSFGDIQSDYLRANKKIRKRISRLCIYSFFKFLLFQYSYNSIKAHLSPRMQRKIFQNCQRRTPSNFIKNIAKFYRIRKETLTIHYDLVKSKK